MSKKLIIINGFGRGGTNILWNILQSHPQVCSAIYETGELLTFLFPPKTTHIRGIRRRMYANQPPLPILPDALQLSLIRRRLHNFKMKNLSYPEVNEKYEDVPYTHQEVADTILCLKSIGTDIDLNPFLQRLYPDHTIYHILLVRNGYALAEGHLRRGRDLAGYARFYQETIDKMYQMLADSKQHAIMLRFEEMLLDPFKTAKTVYQFTDLTPRSLDKLRLKSKKVVR